MSEFLRVKKDVIFYPYGRLTAGLHVVYCEDDESWYLGPKGGTLIPITDEEKDKLDKHLVPLPLDKMKYKLLVDYAANRVHSTDDYDCNYTPIYMGNFRLLSLYRKGNLGLIEDPGMPTMGTVESF